MVETTVSTEEQTAEDHDDAEQSCADRPISHPAATGFVRDWHAALDTSGTEKQDQKHLADRGDRALLRRCRSIDEVLLTPVYFEVRHQLKQRGVDVEEDWDGNRRLASVVGLLARVKVNDERTSFARQLATRKEETDDIKLSGMRFRRLLEIDDRNALYEKMVGVIRLLDAAVNVPSFVRDIYYWRPGSDCSVRKKWAERYYSQAPDEA